MLTEMVCSKCHEVRACMIKNGETICLKCAKKEANVDDTLGFPVIKKDMGNDSGTEDKNAL